jgi:hypothetical protein
LRRQDKNKEFQNRILCCFGDLPKRQIGPW